MDFNPLLSDQTTPPARVRLAYCDGSWIDSEQLSLNVRDLGFTQSVTAVERIRAYQGNWFQVERHLDRFLSTASALGIVGLPDRTIIESLLDQLVVRNQEWLEQADNFGGVLFATPGCPKPGPSVSNPTFVLDLHSNDVDGCENWIRHGSPLVVTTIQQPPPESWSRQLKVRCRLHYYLADRAANDAVAESNGILLDQDGSITETSLSNILIVESGVLICPEREQILWGVSLQVILELAKQHGISVRFERIQPDRLRAADEVLQTGTRCGLWFASSVDGSALRSAGPVYLRLRAAFETLVGGG